MQPRTRRRAEDVQYKTSFHVAPGMIISSICKACGNPRTPGKPHSDKCSKKLQQMSRRGEL
jgi:uncharacterized OB-fold protein